MLGIIEGDAHQVETNKALIIMEGGSHILSRDSLFSLINGQEVNPKPRV